jgi:hypothetical protein
MVPGGLFAPMLTLGAQLGLVFDQLCLLALPGSGIEPTVFAIVGIVANQPVEVPVRGGELDRPVRCRRTASAPCVRHRLASPARSPGTVSAGAIPPSRPAPSHRCTWLASRRPP